MWPVNAIHRYRYSGHFVDAILTDLLTRPCERPAGGAAETAETGGAAAA